MAFDDIFWAVCLEILMKRGDLLGGRQMLTDNIRWKKDGINLIEVKIYQSSDFDLGTWWYIGNCETCSFYFKYFIDFDYWNHESI